MLQGLLQGQGKLVWKMRLMPSSLDSKSHRKLTQLVDSKHKKVYKVKTVATTVDPEKEKEAREKVRGNGAVGGSKVSYEDSTGRWGHEDLFVRRVCKGDAEGLGGLCR